jgi:hypothetical protein
MKEPLGQACAAGAYASRPRAARWLPAGNRWTYSLPTCGVVRRREVRRNAVRTPPPEGTGWWQRSLTAPAPRLTFEQVACPARDHVDASTCVIPRLVLVSTAQTFVREQGRQGRPLQRHGPRRPSRLDGDRLVIGDGKTGTRELQRVRLPSHRPRGCEHQRRAGLTGRWRKWKGERLARRAGRAHLCCWKPAGQVSAALP